MIKLNQRAKPYPDVIVTELENREGVLLNLTTKMYYTLNETGLRIWQILDSGCRLGEVGAVLSNEFDVTPEMAEKSVLNLVGELSVEKLVKVTDE